MRKRPLAASRLHLHAARLSVCVPDAGSCARAGVCGSASVCLCSGCGLMRARGRVRQHVCLSVFRMPAHVCARACAAARIPLPGGERPSGQAGRGPEDRSDLSSWCCFRRLGEVFPTMQHVRDAAGSVVGLRGALRALVGMHNRTFWPCLTGVHRIPSPGCARVAGFCVSRVHGFSGLWVPSEHADPSCSLFEVNKV
jgi:hypothetical protein